MDSESALCGTKRYLALSVHLLSVSFARYPYSARPGDTKKIRNLRRVAILSFNGSGNSKAAIRCQKFLVATRPWFLAPDGVSVYDFNFTSQAANSGKEVSRFSARNN
jgi:hypothetical protein